MSNRKAFSTTKNKLAQLWEQSQDSKAVINTTIKSIDTGFLSIHDFKRPQALTILDNYFQNSGSFTFGQEFSIILKDFPEWAISCSHLSISIATWDVTTSNTAPFDITKTIPDFQIAFDNHTLKNKDKEIASIQYNYWWTKLSNGWKITFQPYFFILEASDVTNFGWSASPIDLWLTVKLQLLNDKNLNAIQSGK